ncbi:HAMP domain-containing sensor histidine kinase [Verminephrobacter aporrectodeae]|uniref:HAMP domain-containing sensor histidine kinase n=1 Tax=Verminephrobacter aporrectodeae TaxID=1110389 RepID=UPI0022386443|nr:HAMP domain-containing sensor histidine kinase [Verminephrobacter aporrectodeae]MCW5255422.1 sensor histidine kinase [Verminephrobacter aporrectodeae subsp. tuberculatae]MCW8176997.1 sensor histidine kinase [Verminephrobacter aporrectodeae subsp. tuberculatae]MCW8200165.1 sensor histidine kinase [Verminephrobacter aporrectodeae subsp. tuberculatae]MCW8204495.1 sensor histidine kinase [Verminephrobacter aporrectodeae subsp. tuberculatae]MCW8208365.1 sensor histidine kinase [Verminephrobacter
MPLPNPFTLFSRRLYLRIWLAMVGSMALLMLAAAGLVCWRIARNAQPFVPPAREVLLRDPAGELLLRGQATRLPGAPGEDVAFRIESDTGQSFTLQIAPRSEHGDRPGAPNRSPAAFWTHSFDFLWPLGFVSLLMAVGVYPVIRRLTLRLEALQRSVQKFGEGDLSVRVSEQGRDEVADLAHQFNAAAERVETLIAAHKSLLANASHELRSPLTRMRIGLELMGGERPSPALREEILRSISELDQLVDEILLTSRLNAREADVGTMEPVDLIGLTAEECARVDARLDAADPLEVRGIAKLLRRALRNLLENARRYSTGPITVVLQRHPDYAEVRVCDRGPGVPVNQRGRIFEPFYRLPGTSEREGGVGLGLALVRSIATRHSGAVHCEAHAGGGACFVLRLPLHPSG